MNRKEQTASAKAAGVVQAHGPALAPTAAPPASWQAWALAIGAMTLATLWAYWTTIVSLVDEWQHNQNYSVGQLVIPAALYMLWNDRTAISRLPLRICWWGLAVVAVAQLARGYGLAFLFESAERYALVLTMVGLVLLMAGWRTCLRIRWVLAFLFLMVPLPGRVHNAISAPLQDLATQGAVFSLELIGVSVAREGHILLLNDTVPVAVAEACSGLRMLTAFVVVGCVLAYVVDRPRWQQRVVVLSTIPVAILCNLIRLVLTAQLYLMTDSEFAEKFFHDFAGWTMMPIAIGMLVGVLWVMNRLTMPPTAMRSAPAPA
jgi:exosortase